MWLEDRRGRPLRTQGFGKGRGNSAEDRFVFPVPSFLLTQNVSAGRGQGGITGFRGQVTHQASRKKIPAGTEGVEGFPGWHLTSSDMATTEDPGPHPDGEKATGLDLTAAAFRAV